MNLPLIEAMSSTEATSIDEVPLPTLVSEKLNGIRAIWNPEANRFQTKRHKFWRPWMTEKIWGKNVTPPTVALDGEFYIPGAPLGTIASACGVTILEDPGVDIIYGVFDVIVPITSARRRITLLDSLTHLPCEFVQHILCETREELQGIYDHFKSRNAEGIVCRHVNSPYAHGVRSSLVHKLKFFKEIEVTVIDFVEGEGKFSGTLGAMLVRDAAGRVFSTGGGEMTNEDRNRVWANRPRYLNQLATIKFPYTSGDSVPLQSVFIAWRNYE
jgi:DNA ligase-1